MAGQVKHTIMFAGGIMPDLKFMSVLAKLPFRSTDALIGAVASVLRDEGIELIDSTYFIKDQLAEEGVLTRRKPDETERGNIEYGLRVANEIARLDLGQTIVVRAKACVAIEAMEGTDAVIKRAGELAKGKLTVVKVAKPNQDMRFDVPVVGVPTIKTMIAAGATEMAPAFKAAGLHSAMYVMPVLMLLCSGSLFGAARTIESDIRKQREQGALTATASV